MEHGPAIITSHSTSNSGSSRGFLKKRLTSPIMGSALISSFVSSTSLGIIGSSGRARMMNVSSRNYMKSRNIGKWCDGEGLLLVHVLSSSSCQLPIDIRSTPPSGLTILMKGREGG